MAAIVCGFDDQTTPAVTEIAGDFAGDLEARLVRAPLTGGHKQRVRTLLDVAASESAELIVVGSRGRGAVAAALFGSVSRCLARTAPCAVAIVTPSAAERHRSTGHGPGRPIICGIDGSERSTSGAILAGSLAKRLGERLVLTYARETPNVGAPGQRAEHEIIGSAVAAIDTEAEVAIEHGPAAHALLSIAARTRARMIVIAPRGVGGVRAVFLGSVTSFLAANAPCPLVVAAAQPPD